MTSISPRKIPHDLEAETAIIGSCLIDPDRVAELALEDKDFYIVRNGVIFQAMQTIVRSGMALDYATLISHLDARKQLDYVGGSGYISGAIARTPTSFHVHDYAAIVKDRAARRALIALAGQIAGDCYNESTDLDACRSEWLAEMVATASIRGKAQPVSIVATALAHDIEDAAANPREVYGIPTGFIDFDRITKGLHRGEVTLLSGQPGMGKSLFAGQSAFQMAAEGHPGVYYAMEMQDRAVLRRQLSGLTQITTGRLRGGDVRDGELAAMYASLGYLGQLPLYISDSTGWTPSELRADVARLKSTAAIEFIVIDHVGKMRVKANDANERDTLISGALHDIAKEYDIALVAIQRLNKVGIRNGAAASLADSFGSVSWVFDADNVWFFTEHLPQDGETQSDRVRTLTAAKFREDEKDRYLHLVQKFVTETGKDGKPRARGIPRFDNYSEGL